MTAPAYNFAAGPAMMPRPVLERARDELLDWRGTGMSVWEMPFTGDAFRDIMDRAEARLRALLAVPSNYKILFMQGGASAQFSLVPLNLLPRSSVADYVETGHWSRRAIGEARRYGSVTVAASAEGSGFREVPDPATWRMTEGAAYCHITPNETAGGLEMAAIPDIGATPLVADLTSSFLSRPLALSRFGVIYAGAQKNIGPSGLTLVIVRDDLLDRVRQETPTVFTYSVLAASGSRVNTPLTYAIYLAGLVFEWLEGEGGLDEMLGRSRLKSAMLYAEIDRDDFYKCPIALDNRSRMNICFGLGDQALEARFLEEAEAAGLLNLKGHRDYGALRASIYNAMPEEGVAALATFMVDFRRRWG